MSKVWFITGTSKGFGRVWAEAALERGDRVAATARDTSALDGLVERYGDNVLPLRLDVTDKAAIDEAVEAAHERFGRLDVVVNNAGYGLLGAIEELSEEQARAQIETNVFGALWVTQAALPIMRAQGGGHILQVSSIGGVMAFPMLGLYHASKWALEAFSQSLAAEVKPYGIKVTIIEPAGFSTDWSGPSAVQATQLPEYEHVREARRQLVSSRPAPGDPEATGAVVLELVDMEEPPLRQIFGDGAFPNMIRPEIERRLAEWEAGDERAVQAHGTPVAR